MGHFSLREAANEAGTSKSTIWRAIKAGRLSATRTYDGGFAIDPAELFRVFQPRQIEQRSEGRGGGETDELASELAILDAEVKALRELLAEVRASRDELRQDRDNLRQDRDHWQMLAERARPVLAGSEQRHWFVGSASSEKSG